MYRRTHTRLDPPKIKIYLLWCHLMVSYERISYLEWSWCIDTNLITTHVVIFTFIHIEASFPIRIQQESIRTHAKNLVVTVNALVRAASIFTHAPPTWVTCVIVLCQRGSRQIITATLFQNSHSIRLSEHLKLHWLMGKFYNFWLTHFVAYAYN